MFMSRTEIMAKSAISDIPSAKKKNSSENCFTLEFSKEPNIVWDSFCGGENHSYDLFFRVTDRHNANP